MGGFRRAERRGAGERGRSALRAPTIRGVWGAAGSLVARLAAGGGALVAAAAIVVVAGGGGLLGPLGALVTGVGEQERVLASTATDARGADVAAIVAAPSAAAPARAPHGAGSPRRGRPRCSRAPRR